MFQNVDEFQKYGKRFLKKSEAKIMIALLIAFAVPDKCRNF